MTDRYHSDSKSKVYNEYAAHAPAEGVLGLTSGNNFVQIHTPAHIQMLAEAGVKDIAEALGVSHTSHAAKVR